MTTLPHLVFMYKALCNYLFNISYIKPVLISFLIFSGKTNKHIGEAFFGRIGSLEDYKAYTLLNFDEKPDEILFVKKVSIPVYNVSIQMLRC